MKVGDKVRTLQRSTPTIMRGMEGVITRYSDVCTTDVWVSFAEFAKDELYRLDELDPVDTTKDTNPKDAIGSKKSPLSVLSFPVLYAIGSGMLEGSCKYGRHNYRTAGVRASVYVDAAFRHLAAFWEGEDIDSDSGQTHIIKVMSCLHVLADSMHHGNWQDDRPPKAPADWIKRAQEQTDAVLERYPNPLPPHTEV